MKSNKFEDGHIAQDFEHRITKLESDNDSIKNSLFRIEKRLDDMDKKFESKIDNLDRKIDNLDRKFDAKINNLENKLESKIYNLDKKIDSNFKWLLGIILSNTGILLTVMAKGFHWF